MIAKLSHAMQQKDKTYLNVVHQPDGPLAEPGINTLQQMVNHHFPTSSPIDHIPYNNTQNTPSAPLLEQNSSCINPKLICLAFSGFLNKKSPSPDELKPIIF